MPPQLYFLAGLFTGAIVTVLLWFYWEVINWVAGEKRPPEDKRERWNDSA